MFHQKRERTEPVCAALFHCLTFFRVECCKNLHNSGGLKKFHLDYFLGPDWNDWLQYLTIVSRWRFWCSDFESWKIYESLHSSKSFEHVLQSRGRTHSLWSSDRGFKSVRELAFLVGGAFLKRSHWCITADLFDQTLDDSCSKLALLAHIWQKDGVFGEMIDHGIHLSYAASKICL